MLEFRYVVYSPSIAPTMTSAISTFLESLVPASAGVGLLLSGMREAGAGNPSEMGATAEGRNASNATSAKRSNEPRAGEPSGNNRPRTLTRQSGPLADRYHLVHLPLFNLTPLSTYCLSSLIQNIPIFFFKLF